MTTYLALYTDAGGPISFEIKAESAEDALRVIEREGRQRFDDAANELDLDPDADDDAVTAALDEQCWSTASVCRTDDQLWTLHVATV